ncbi:hypothetical protein JOM56_013351 [Amanita muscaria]
MSVTGRKHIADDVFCPQATSTPRAIPFSRGDDEDIPLALVMELRSASIARRPSTVTPPGPIRSQAAEVDNNEDLPLVKVKERMMMKFDLRPMIKRVVRLRRQPPTKPKKFGQTVRDLGPRPTAMMCLVPDCPYDWHVHRVW